VTNSTFIIVSRFDPTHSLVGRLFRAMAADARQGESLFILSLSLFVLVLVLLGTIGWTMLPFVRGAGSDVLAPAGVAAVLLIVTTCLIGRRPEIAVRVNRNSLTISSSGGELRIPFAEIESIARVDDRTYYRHYRRYAETRGFVNRIPSELLLLRVGGVPVVLGIESAADLGTLEALLLAGTKVSGRASSPVDAA
jgi:hypothetical protein